MAGILDEIAKQVESMSEDELRAEFLKAQEERHKRKTKQLEYNAKPEMKAKRLEYQKKRNEQIKQDPEKYGTLQAKRKEYMSRPEVKAKQKDYRTKRNELQKQLIARAKELGIHDELVAAAKAKLAAAAQTEQASA
jgi:hypothetical protein